MTHKSNNRHAESGNVLFYILIAIALLASLSYAVSQSSRGGGSQITQERINLMATEMLEYTDLIGKSVAQLKLRGCDSESASDSNKISFRNTASASYNHATASDTDCRIFEFDGGGMTFRDAPDNASNISPSILFDGNMEVENMGNTCAGPSCSDLLIIFRDIQENLCIRLNEMVNVTNPAGVPPVDTSFNFVPFVGLYTYNGTLGDEAAELDGRKAGCGNDGGTYHFYKVLIAR